MNQATQEILARADLARRLAEATVQRDDRSLLLELASQLEKEAEQSKNAQELPQDTE